MNRIINYIVEKMIEKNIIQKKYKNDYKYGIEIFFLKVIGILIFLSIGVISNYLLETVVFYIVFSSLRTYTNGYHSNNRLMCFIESTILYLLITMYLVKILEPLYILNIILSAICSIVIMIYAPINSEQINLSDEEIKIHKFKIKKILLITLIINIIIIIVNIKSVFITFITFALILDTILILIPKIMTKN